MSLALLQDFLNKHEFPTKEDKTGFLEIIGKQSNENIISKLYAYFINCDNVAIRSAFVESLIEVIEKKGKSIKIHLPEAKTEVRAANGKRIDLLLIDKDETSCIIIENKIYHWLHNSLIDYWNFNKSRTKFYNGKIGVLLTLEKNTIPFNVKDKFINITHDEWIRKIRSRILSIEIPEKQLIYLTDFLNTMENLTKAYPMDNQTKFYFNNAKKITQAIQTQESAFNFLNDQLQLVAEKLGFDLYGSELEWKNIWDKKNDMDIYFTIILSDLIEGNKMGYRLILEFSDWAFKNYKGFEKFVKTSECYKSLEKTNREEGDDYIHFAYKDYDVNLEELNNLGEHILANIKLNFSALALSALKYFYGRYNYYDKVNKDWTDSFKQK